MNESIDSNHPSERILVRCFAVLTLLIVFAIAGMLLAGQWVVANSNSMYLKARFAHALVRYLQEHDNRWPSSWDDLKPLFEDKSLAFDNESVRDEICLDFSVTSDWICENLGEIRSGKIKLITGCTGNNTHYEGMEPNEILCEYFDRQCKSDRQP